MKWYEPLTSVAGMLAVLGVLYLNVIDGLKTQTTIAAILVVAGLGGYKVLADYLRLRKGK